MSPGYGDERALARHNSCRSAASVQHECAVCDGLFHNGVLRRELFEKHSSESDQLLQNADGAGQIDQPSQRRPTFRFDRKNARSRGDARDFLSAEHRRRSWILAT
jgi:hypothetical protein